MNKPMDARLLQPAEAFSGYQANTAARIDVGAEAKAHESGTRVGISRPHESAQLHVAGEADYIDDLPELAGTLHCALGLSPVAAGRLVGVDLQTIRALPGVVAVLTAADIPGSNDCGSIVHDDPILCDGEIRYLGQPVFAVIAETRDAARRAAARAKDVIRCDATTPVLTPQDAHAKGQYVVPPMHLVRSSDGIGSDGQAGVRAAIARAPHRLSATFDVGGQEQFYLEGQISYAVPKEGGAMYVHCSTQHPSEMQHLVAHALHLHANQVHVECRRMGGGFGGKESQSGLFACVAAVAANQLRRPVKLRLDRDDDFMITGRRHCFWYEYEVGYDDEGHILGAEITMVSRAGHSADLSGPVMTRALCHFDNAYWLPDVAMHGYSGKTNTQSNTAFRGFGGPQGAIAIENILDSVARELGRDPLDIRRINFYGTDERNVTPYGEVVTDNVIHELVAELESTSDYRTRREAIDAFNAASPVLKRGLALAPLKFGISFNVPHFNQAGALVHVYNDGSILVNHGGTEMGQGLNTKVAQVVAHELGVSFDVVRVTATDTQKIANTSATAASTGSDLNGKAAQDAARQIRERLAACAAARHGGDAKDVRFVNDKVLVNGRTLPFGTVVGEAYLDRVQLWSDGFYSTPGLSWDRETMQGRPFYYYAYGAAVAEVIVDTLTGEFKLLRADILQDAGKSLNPAVDIGQVEGAFIQGMGWLTTEELVWHPTSGKLTTHAPSTYKIPTANDCPPIFNVRLFEGQNFEDSIHRSKAVGEPPLLLPFSVFFAIRDAVSAAGDHRIDPPLRAPATCEAILNAVTAVRAVLSPASPTTMRDQALFDKIDLHLIRVLHTVLTDRSVSRAAIRLGMYQPAVSAALKRLRDLSGDPLLVRSGGGMVPTDAALRMIEPAASILRSAEVLFSDARGFDPQTATNTFRIAASDYLDPLFLPLLVAQVKSQAPLCKIEIHPLSPDSNYHAQLSLGNVDLVIGNWLKPPEDLHMARLFGDEIVSLIHKDHPVGRRGWDIETWLGAEHIAPTPMHPGARGIIDQMLDTLKLQRNITARCAHFSLIPDMVASSLLVLTTGRQYCERFVDRLPVKIIPCPVALPRLMYYQLWHERTHSSSSARWLRDRIKSVAASLRPPPGSTKDTQ